MKNKYVKSGKLILSITLLLISTAVFAQRGFRYRADSAFTRGMGWNYRYGLNLTDEQEEKITALREAHLQEMADLRNDLAINRSELQILKLSDESDLNQINEKLDEIGQLTTEMSKKNAAHEQDILNVLTDEQKALFRSGPYGRYSGYGHMGKGFDYGYWGRGFNRYPEAPSMRMRRGRRF